MKFTGLITNDKSYIQAKGQGQRSKVKFTGVKTQCSRFRNVTPVWIHMWQWNDAQRFMWLRRGALCFSWSSVKFRGHTTIKIEFDPNCRLPENPVWIHQLSLNDAQSLKLHRRSALLFFKVIRQISWSYSTINRRFSPKLDVYGLLLHFEFTDGYKRMHKAWNTLEEVPDCFFKITSQISRSHRTKIADFDPDLAFPDSSSILNWQLAMKWCTRLEVA